MTDPNHLCDLWEHTIVKVFKHDSKSHLGLMLKQWIIFNKLENFNSILNYIIDDFTPSGNLCYINQHGEILHHTPLREVYNNRILSKVQKSFWSCTHVNSCQKYTLYLNLHILLNILCKAT